VPWRIGRPDRHLGGELALKHIAADLTASVSQLQWVVDSYNLTYATLLLTGGVLADLYGRRRIFVAGLALFTIGSLICGFAPDVATLIIGRTIAGIGAALEVPTTLAILAAVYPDPDERALRSASGQVATGSPSSSGRRSAACWSTTKAGAASSC